LFIKRGFVVGYTFTIDSSNNRTMNQDPAFNTLGVITFTYALHPTAFRATANMPVMVGLVAYFRAIGHAFGRPPFQVFVAFITHEIHATIHTFNMG